MLRVRDLMTIACVTAPPTMPVLEARRLMLTKRFRHLLVTDGPRLRGIVTDRDIRLNLLSPAANCSAWEIHDLLAWMTVGSVMSRNVVTIESGQDVKDAAQLMLEHKAG